MNLQHTSGQIENEPQQAAVETSSYVGSAAEVSALEQVRANLAQPAPPDFYMPPLAEALRASDAKTRVDAHIAMMQVMSTLDKAAAQKQKSEEIQHSVDDIMRRLMAETVLARRRKMQRRLKITGFVATIVFLVWASHWNLSGNWWFFWWIGSGAWAADQTMGKQRKSVSELRQAGDPRAVGVLAIAARDTETSVRVPARQALRELLPRVRANHAGDITPAQMNALLELAFRSEPALQIAVLQALEQIGDGRAVPVVQNLSLSPHPRVRDQANHCLPYLTERVRRAEQSATLLRGTISPAQIAAPHELLRSVSQPADNTPASELLRPDTNAREHPEIL